MLPLRDWSDELADLHGLARTGWTYVACRCGWTGKGRAGDECPCCHGHVREELA